MVSSAHRCIGPRAGNHEVMVDDMTSAFTTFLSNVFTIPVGGTYDASTRITDMQP